MEVLLGLGLAGLVLMAPILAIVALARASRLQRELGEAAARIGGLETKLESLAKRVVSGASVPVGASAKPEGPAPAATPVTSPPPPVDTAPRTLPPAQAQQPPPPPPPPPAAVVTPTPAAVAVPQAPSAVGPQPPPPPRPRPTPPPPPAEPPAPAFDWESLLGLKGAAWLGGIAIVIASFFFAKWIYDQGLITPPLGIAGMVLAGVGALAWAELSLRRGYDTTANSVSGAGIAVLYVAFYAGHALYNLFSLPLTFALMALVTVTAGVLAIRYDAFFTAVLGLLGGFATPLALSTGVDNPRGLFSYLLVLGIGLLSVARRQRWPGLVRLGLACTVLIQALWFFRYMSPAKMAIGLGSFFVLGLVYTLATLFDPDGKSDAKAPSGDVAAVAGLVPFAFALILAGGRDYAGEWPLLFGYVALLDLALAALALFRRERISLLLAASGATALLLAIWPMSGLGRSVLWGPVLAAIGLAALMNLPAELARRLNEGDAVEQAPAFEGAGLIAAFGLLLFSAVLVFKGLGEPPWAFIALVLALFLLLVLRTGDARLPQVFAGGGMALAVLVQMWFFREEANGTALLRDLSLPLLLPVALSLVAALRAQAPLDADDDEAGVVVATALTLMGLFGCLGSETRANDAWPLFLALAVADVLLVVSALRRGWAVLVPAALAASALFAFAWHEGHFELADLSVALPAYLAFTFGFLVLPFVVASAGNRIWQGRSAPWLASACAAPAFFPVIYRAFVAAWGKAWIGVLPVSLAVVSVVALAAANRQLSGARSDERLRLRHLALFGAVALGFITLAIPLQLDRQWITVGWALEALAVWWLFGRLPHPGLKFLGVALLAAVGVRLLVNPEVLHYQARGLRILNWLLYTYGVPALSCFVGAAVLARAEAARKSPPEYDWVGGDRTQIGPAASVLGLLLTFWLINLEVFDWFSRGRYVELAFERQFARDLTLSVAWGFYAIVLLVLGLWRSVRPLRMAALAFLVLTVAKVFLYDLSTLTGLYRVLSFLGLGVSLIFVSLLYQKFVIARRDE